jgi:hypothetical protein
MKEEEKKHILVVKINTLSIKTCNIEILVEEFFFLKKKDIFLSVYLKVFTLAI